MWCSTSNWRASLNVNGGYPGLSKVWRQTGQDIVEVGPCGWRVTQSQISFNDGELPIALN